MTRHITPNPDLISTADLPTPGAGLAPGQRCPPRPHALLLPTSSAGVAATRLTIRVVLARVRVLIVVVEAAAAAAGGGVVN